MADVLFTRRGASSTQSSARVEAGVSRLALEVESTVPPGTEHRLQAIGDEPFEALFALAL
jgi:hypothetical protein